MNDYPQFGFTGSRAFVEENNKLLSARPSKQVWEIKFLKRNMHEDNDTSEEETDQSLKGFEDLWTRMQTGDLNEKTERKL